MEVHINCQNQEQKRYINTNYEEIKSYKGILWIALFNKLDNLNERDKFQERYKLLKLILKEIINLNGSASSN